MAFQIVVAATRKLGIGKDGTMPWKLPGDMAYFKKLTSSTVDPQKMNAVVRCWSQHAMPLPCFDAQCCNGAVQRPHT